VKGGVDPSRLDFLSEYGHRQRQESPPRLSIEAHLGGLLFCLLSNILRCAVPFLMARFEKGALAIDDQLALLTGRGLVVQDRDFAAHCLQHISYYRLRAYWYYFEENPQSGVHQFRPNVGFEDIIRLYDFDRRLRLVLMDAIERLEIAMRGAWAHHMATTYGAFGHLRPDLYADLVHAQRNFRDLNREVRRSEETFIAHFKEKYEDPDPPVWMAAEVMSLGLLSRFQSALRHRRDIRAIARPFGLPHSVYLSFGHHLTTIRNICAHHGRLWNKHLTVTLKLPTAQSDLAAAFNAQNTRTIYNSLVLITYYLDKASPQSGWASRLLRLLHEHPMKDWAAMGFPDDWQAREFWRQRKREDR
jgi:abortive infection bacteriophage resistance protein